jgi:hypothetical protein
VTFADLASCFGPSVFLLRKTFTLFVLLYLMSIVYTLSCFRDSNVCGDYFCSKGTIIDCLCIAWLTSTKQNFSFIQKENKFKRHKHYKGNGEEKGQRPLTATTRRVIRIITWQPCWKGIPYAPAEDALSVYGLNTVKITDILSYWPFFFFLICISSNSVVMHFIFCTCSISYMIH